jgi:sulfite exporter TauE/SafE
MYGHSCSVETRNDPYLKRLTEAVILAMILMIGYLMAQEFSLVPTIDTTGTLSLATIAVIGFLASVSTCMATTGALYLATIGRVKDEGISTIRRLTPAFGFTAGRIVTYTGMGAINGLVGQVIAHDLQMETTLNVLVGVMMVFVGLEMLGLFSVSSLLPTGWFSRTLGRIEQQLLRHPRRTSVLLGASTYWLPCGFTQSVQLYALAVADPVQSAIVMLMFVLGTTPAMLGIGFASSFLKTRFYGQFLKVMGVFVFLVGATYVLSFLSLYNLNPLASVGRAVLGEQVPAGGGAAELDNGVQILRMTVTNDGYAPNTFTVQQGRPVRWIVTGEEIFGCQGLLQSPQLGIIKVLSQGENIIEFTPQEPGVIPFSCSVGAVGGTIVVEEAV